MKISENWVSTSNAVNQFDFRQKQEEHNHENPHKKKTSNNEFIYSTPLIVVT